MTEACSNFPELLEEDQTTNYYQPSENAWVEPKKDSYFYNETILKQFKRLFILLKHKKAFVNCEIEIIVDNARTHNAILFIND